MDKSQQKLGVLQTGVTKYCSGCFGCSGPLSSFLAGMHRFCMCNVLHVISY